LLSAEDWFWAQTHPVGRMNNKEKTIIIEINKSFLMVDPPLNHTLNGWYSEKSKLTWNSGYFNFRAYTTEAFHYFFSLYLIQTHKFVIKFKEGEIIC